MKLIKHLSSVDYFLIITSTITIVAFLLGIEYFTDRSELTMKVYQRVPKFDVYYELHNIEDFYIKNKINIPDVIIDDHKYGYLFQTDSLNDFGIPLYESTPFYIKNLLRKDNLSPSLLKYLSDTLYSHIDIFQHKENKFLIRFSHNANIKDVLAHYKNLLSSREYYIFTAAVLRTREIQNTINFNPVGNVDFHNIKIEIHSPNSFVNKDRTNNLLNIKFASNFNILYKIQNKVNCKIIDIPKLYSHHNFSLIVHTKENILTDQEIKLSYDYKPYKNKTNIWVMSIIIFLVLFILHNIQIHFKLK